MIVVADSTKFGRRSLAHLAALGDAHCMVVDDGISEEWKGKVEEAGVKLLIAATSGTVS